MKTQWKIFAMKADFNAIAAKYGIDPVVARIIRNRDIIDDADIDKFLNGDRSQLYDGALMKDMDKATSIILSKIEANAKIRIIGDYDIDGISSIYILYMGLTRLGADVDYVIPHRIHDGYGINENLVNDAYNDGIDTIVTCDNGISAINQIAHAKSLNMTVVVTDHHDIHYKEDDNGNRIYEMPNADACIDPKREDDEYPFKGLCGAMVAYKLIECLFKIKEIKDDELMDELFSIGALATIGDIMVLSDENRIIVKEGLKILNRTNNIGFKALCQLNNVKMGEIKAYHIGFIIGPCLNASGRLDTAKYSVELLCAREKGVADKLAGDLVALNEERKNLTAENTERAIDMISNTDMANDNVLVVYLNNCHESIAGIIAGRIRERFYKPTIVLTDSEKGLKGSGRSIDSYNMFEHLLEVEDIFTAFGGHPKAAGVSLPKEKLEELRRRLNENAHLTEADLTNVEWIDVPMPVDYVTEELIEQLDVLEPFGNGNSKPVFSDRNLYVERANLIGKNRNVLKLVLRNANGYKIDAIKFNADSDLIDEIKVGGNVSIVYYPSVNEFNGNRSIQAIINEIFVS